MGSLPAALIGKRQTQGLGAYALTCEHTRPLRQALIPFPTMRLIIPLLALLRTALRLAPTGVAITFFRWSRSAFSIRLNRLLEDHVFASILKGRAETLSLPRIFVPLLIERRMTIRVGDESQRYYWIGDFDEVANYVVRHLRPADAFIDIGANCGFVTLLASSVVPAQRIWSFEPNPDTFRELRANLDLNELPVNAVNLGLSDTPGRVRLFVPDGACGGSSIEAKNYQRRDLLPGETLPSRFHEIDVVRFDDFWTGRQPQLPDDAQVLVKIDSEGHELPIITGMRDFIAAHRERLTLLIEVYESEYDAALKALSAHGFTCFSILGDGTTAPAVRPEKNRFSNYCFKMARPVGSP